MPTYYGKPGTLDKASGIVFDHALPFDILGRRPYRPRARPAADRDITVEMDAPKMQDVLKGYTRLR